MYMSQVEVLSRVSWTKRSIPNPWVGATSAFRGKVLLKSLFSVEDRMQVHNPVVVRDRKGSVGRRGGTGDMRRVGERNRNWCGNTE
jgi:hypothetical protein